MKLINHKQNNSYNINTYIMRGTIEMTPKEWLKAYMYLWGQWQKAIKDIDTYKRDGLSSLDTKKEQLFSIGVSATSLLVKKYHLKGYKNQNYGIKII